MMKFFEYDFILLLFKLYRHSTFHVAAPEHTQGIGRGKCKAEWNGVAKGSKEIYYLLNTWNVILVLCVMRF